jgi:hypothetical protein
MKKSLSILWVLVLAIFSSSAIAQDNLEELSEMLDGNYDKLMKSGIVQHQSNVMKYPSGYKNIIQKPFSVKRVGILSFNIMEGTNDGQFNRDILKSIINSLKDDFETSIKEAGKNDGIEVLTPNDYLISQELRTRYNSLNLKGAARTPYLVPANDYIPGIYFEAINTPVAGIPKEDYNEIGDFMTAADLDAVIIVTVSAVLEVSSKKGDRKQQLSFYSVASNTILNNQTSFDPDVKYPKILGGYISGFGGCWNTVVKSGLPIQTFYKKDEKYEYAGYNKVKIMTDLQLDQDYTTDLNAVVKNFSKYIVSENIAAVNQLNEKNKKLFDN